MKKGPAVVHKIKRISNAPPDLLDAGFVSDEHGQHLHTCWRDVTDGGLEIVGDPFNEISQVLADHFKHFIINFIDGHGSMEHHHVGEVPSMLGVGSTHHVLGIKCLRSKLVHRQRAEIRRARWCQWSKSHKEEMQMGKGDHIHRELLQVAVQLAQEMEGAHRSSDGHQDEQVEINKTGLGSLSV